MKKRIFFLAFLLIICLLCGMFPLTAMAEETTMGDRPPLPTRESLVVYEGTFQEAFREGMTLKEALSSDHVKSVND
ncbi:MAG: hypothetical protein IJY42_06180, partial [Clostridia bacterium]|nr:hypothetical protein [Clostridia bacterium]